MIGYCMYKFLVGPIGYVGVFWICFGAKVIGFFLGFILDENHDWKKKSV
jgi:hypothetical protein